MADAVCFKKTAFRGAPLTARRLTGSRRPGKPAGTGLANRLGNQLEPRAGFSDRRGKAALIPTAGRAAGA